MTWDELKRLNPRDIGVWPLPAKLGAVALMSLVLMALAAYFGWLPQYDDLDAKEKQEVTDRKSTRLNSSHRNTSRMPSSA